LCQCSDDDVPVFLAGCKKTPEKKAPQIAEERTRTVLLDGCPQNTTNSELWGQFPTAEMITLPMWKGKPTGNAFVCFATVAAAEKAAGRGTVSVMGKHVRMAMRGTLFFVLRQKESRWDCLAFGIFKIFIDILPLDFPPCDMHIQPCHGPTVSLCNCSLYPYHAFTIDRPPKKQVRDRKAERKEFRLCIAILNNDKDISKCYGSPA